MINKNFLLIFEGIDGTGKSSLAKYFARKTSAFYFKEPTFFRKKIFSKISHLTELFLFLAGRSETYFEIKRILKKKSVILDRSFPSTLAYQLEGRELKKVIPIKDYLKFDRLARQNIQPDLVIILDAPVEVALKRIKRKTKFEEKAFLDRVRKSYLKLANKFNWYIVDATKPLNLVKNDVLLILKKEGLLK